MSTFFFNTENSVNPSWSNVAEGLNVYYEGLPPGLGQVDLTKIKKYDNFFNSYIKIDKKLGIYNNQEGKLLLAMAMPTPGQSMGIKEIDLDKAKAFLDSGLEVVYFGYLFTEEMVSQNTVIENSCFFGRNVLDKRPTNLTRQSVLEGNPYAAIWMAFYKMVDTDVYYVVINDNLLESSIIKSDESEINLRDRTDVIEFLNSHDGNLRDSVFTPSLDSNSKFIGPNIIATTGDTVVIDLFGYNSKFHKIAGRRLGNDELPRIRLDVECSGNYQRDSNTITISLNKDVTTLSYRWVTGTELDYISSKQEQLRYDFVIIRH
jgi:hypothetical protein